VVAKYENKIGDSWYPSAACINRLGVRLCKALTVPSMKHSRNGTT
jgi:hypothetical protein